MQIPPFAPDLEALISQLNHASRINSLAQTLLKHTSPGVPDLYQGSELWDHSLVDPDNRRKVDYSLRQSLLHQLSRLSVEEVLERMEEGLPKLKVIHTALQLRARKPDWFGAKAEYTPLAVTGTHAERVIAFLRGSSVVTIVPRLTTSVGSDWAETTIYLPHGQWTDRLTAKSCHGGETRVGDLLADFPVALLTLDEAFG